MTDSPGPTLNAGAAMVALQGLWWGGGCGDGRGLGAIPAPEYFFLQYLARYFTGEEAGCLAAGR